MTTAAEIAGRFLADQQLCGVVVKLNLDGYRISLKSNSEQLLSHLERYFSHVVAVDSKPADIEIVCIESDITSSGFDFVDWKREPGKTGRKDAYFDLEDARLVLKVRTEMLFLQHEKHRIAIGPCNEYDNQVINFFRVYYGADVIHEIIIVVAFYSINQGDFFIND